MKVTEVINPNEEISTYTLSELTPTQLQIIRQVTSMMRLGYGEFSKEIFNIVETFEDAFGDEFESQITNTFGDTTPILTISVSTDDGAHAIMQGSMDFAIDIEGQVDDADDECCTKCHCKCHQRTNDCDD